MKESLAKEKQVFPLRKEKRRRESERNIGRQETAVKE
jgi:hypothetical protein